MQKIEDKTSLLDGSKVGVMLPDWVVTKGAPLVMYI